MSSSDSLSAMSRPLNAAAAVLVVGLCLSWGFNQVAVKLAIGEIPPLIQAAIRSGVAAALVALWMRWRGVSFTLRDGTLIPGLVAGILFGVEFVLLFRGLLWTTASRAVLFLYLAPFFVVLGLRILIPADRFRPTQWLGLGLSFAGMLVAFGIPAPASDPYQFAGDVMTVVAAASWAATTLVIKASRLATAPAEKTLLYQLAISALILAVAAPLFGERMTAMPGPLALGALAYQAVWVAAITYLAWFSLMMRFSASRLSAFTFLTPIFGVAAGWLVLGDPLSPAFGVAVGLVATGLVLVNRRN